MKLCTIIFLFYNMLAIGLTGGMGVGKSTVAEMFAKRGVPIIDADVIARDITQVNTPTYKIIRKHFTDAILLPSGQLDRKKLRSIIFKDEKQRIWLEQLLHPIIREEIVNKLRHLSNLYAIVVIPLLVEVNAFPFIDRVLVVDAPLSVQTDRIKTRDNHNDEEIKAILATQAEPIKRLDRADDIITNDGDLQELANQVERLHQFYTALALK